MPYNSIAFKTIALMLRLNLSCLRRNSLCLSNCINIVAANAILQETIDIDTGVNGPKCFSICFKV